MAREEADYLESTRERKFVISPGNAYKFYWDLFIIILAVYNACALPLMLAFAEVQTLYDEMKGLIVLEVLVDVFFLFDIFIMFNTAYIDVLAGETIW